MNNTSLYELFLDNLDCGVFILDDKGHYIFGNAKYLEMIGMTREELSSIDVHYFLRTGQVEFVISDIVYKEKRQVIFFQDALPYKNIRTKADRRIQVQTPIFNSNGDIQYIVVSIRSLADINEAYHCASSSRYKSTLYPPASKDSSFEFENVIAESTVMKDILTTAKAVSDIDASVLLYGESGTGKEVVANYIHNSGDRAHKPMITLNCAAIPENLIEAELFGYEKGAFTGADPHGKKGCFEMADGGTLFLDEINSLPLSVQGKLLRALENHHIHRIGSSKEIPVDIRIISATNEDLLQMLEQKTFRADLYYRLDVIPITIPPLRKRREDIIPLALHFLKFYCQKYNRSKLFTPETIARLQLEDWPGNVRELKNFVERSVIMNRDEYINISPAPPLTITTKDASVSPVENTDISLLSHYDIETLLDEGMSLEEYMDQCEKDFLTAALNRYKSSYTAAAALKTNQSLIMRRKKKHGI